MLQPLPPSSPRHAPWHALLRYAVLYNPVAGQGRAASVAGDVAALLKDRGHSVELRASERAGHIAELAREVPCERLLVLGGDGSLREAAAGLLRRQEASGEASDPDLGILPFGTGNVVARELSLPLDPLQAAAQMETSGAVPFDVGFARSDRGEPEPFLAMLGVGYDAAVARRIGASRARPLGRVLYRRGASVLYAWQGLRELCALWPPRFDVEVDGTSLASRASSLVISNTETYGKGMSMSPGASPCDGRLDLHVRTKTAPWVGVTTLVTAQLRRDAPCWAAMRAIGESVSIEAENGAFAWQLDGDPMPAAMRLDVTLRPAALRLIGAVRARQR